MNATAPSLNPRLAQQAYEAMRGMIESGRLRPGETVSEVRLAEMLAISRTPVREAARRLAAQGLLETTPRGLRVFRPGAEEVAEVYFLRAAIEGAVARAAAAAPSTRHLTDLRRVHAESLTALAAGDVSGLVACNGRFHGRLVEATGAGRAVAALRDLEPLVAAYRRLSLLSPEHRRASLDEHAALIGALERRDGEGAEALMRAHIAGAGRRVVEAVRHMEAAADAGGDGPHLRNLDSLAAPERAAAGRTER